MNRAYYTMKNTKELDYLNELPKFLYTYKISHVPNNCEIPIIRC